MRNPTRLKPLLNSRAAVGALLVERRDLLAVSSLSSTLYDLAAAGDNPLNFYLWGGMGGAIMVGLGLALAQPSRPVLVVTGDGEMLMGLGGLATIAVQRPKNLSIVVIDNEHYAETGFQESHTAHGCDLPGIAASAGFPCVHSVRTEPELAELVPLIHRSAGPLFAAIKVTAAPPSFLLPPNDGVYLKNRFRAALGVKS